MVMRQGAMSCLSKGWQRAWEDGGSGSGRVPCYDNRGLRGTWEGMAWHGERQGAMPCLSKAWRQHGKAEEGG